MKTQIMLVQAFNCILITSLLIKETMAKPTVILNPYQVYDYPDAHGDFANWESSAGDNTYISTSTDELYLEESTSTTAAPEIAELSSASNVVTTKGKSLTITEFLTSTMSPNVPTQTASSIFEDTSAEPSGRASRINSSATESTRKTDGIDIGIGSQQKTTSPGSYSDSGTSNYQVTTLNTSKELKPGQSSSKSTEIPSTSASKTTPVSESEPEPAAQLSSTTVTTTTTTTKAPLSAVSKINDSTVKLRAEGKLELELPATVLFQVLSMLITRPEQTAPPALTVEQILELSSLLQSKPSDDRPPCKKDPLLNANQVVGVPLTNSLSGTKTEIVDEPVPETTAKIQHTPLSHEKEPTPKYTTSFVNIGGRTGAGTGTGTGTGSRFGSRPIVSNGQRNYVSVGVGRSGGSRLKLGNAVKNKNTKFNNM